MANLSKTESIEFMLKQFKPERYTYLCFSVLSFMMLLLCVILFIIKEEMSEKNLGYVAGMAGSGGAIAYTASQVLRMWRDCMSLLTNTRLEEEDGK
jgi:hypothetical protein